MMCISGPPWLPGETPRLIDLTSPSSLVMIISPRGPRRGLCGVVLSTCAGGGGEGCGPPGANPRVCARAAQGFVRRGADNVRVRERRRMRAAGDQSGNVRDVGEEQRADLIGDLAEPREVNRPRIRAVSAQDHPRLELLRFRAHRVEVDRL